MKNICVTALYNIGREAYDGRKFDDYLQWFEQILRLNTPLVVYSESNLKEWVMDRRKGKPTWFVEQSLTDIPYYQYKDMVSKIIHSPEFKTRVNQPQRLECNLAEYTLVIYSKLHWMIDAAKRYGSEDGSVFWVDAGCSRFIDPRLYSLDFPNPAKVESLGDRFFIQMSRNYPDLIQNKSLPENYFWLAKPLTAAGFMGGKVATIQKIAEKVRHVFEEEMLAKGVVATEENAIGYLIKTDPDLFMPVINTTGHPLQSIHMMG